MTVADLPEEFSGTVEPPKGWAAGATAVAVSLRRGVGQMGARRTLATLRTLNQPDGFDCPGCAWPEPGHAHVAEFCENGVKAVAEEATTARITPAFFAEHSIAELRQRSEHWLGQQGRLTEPMVKRSGSTHYEPISWPAAFELIATELRGLPSPDAAAFYTSCRTSNEAAFLYQLLARTFGTNNLPDCSNMCHEASGMALTETIGIGKGSVHVTDFAAADLIVVVGQNPGTNHPRMLTTLEAAKRAGATIVAINPLPEAGLQRFKNPQRLGGLFGSGTQLADEHLPIRINGDLAFFKAVNHLLVTAGDDALDAGFIEHYTNGFERFAGDARTFDWEHFTRATGFTRDVAERFTEHVRASERIIVCWAMGLTQHANSVATIREVVNFLLARGNIGRPGAGVCPVRGHSNVQGDRTMGIHERPAPAFLDALAAEFGFEPPREAGLDTVDTIGAMRDGDVQVFVGMGGNFASATPDTAVTHAALERCRLTVQVSTKLNMSHLVTGDQALILPTMGRTERHEVDGREQLVTVEDSMGVVHASRGTLPKAAPTLLSEVEIVCAIAQALFGGIDAAARAVGPTITPPIDWGGFARDHAVVRDSISRVVPGFDDFEAKIAAAGGFVLPHGPRDDRTFATADGRAQFTVNELSHAGAAPGTLLLQTIRSHDQYNTTIYGLDDRYRGVHNGRRVVFVSPDDLAAAGLRDGDVVDLRSVDVDGVERVAPRFRVIEYPTPAGSCAAYYPETNVLVPLASTNAAGTPAFKSIPITLTS
jgi:molybdopterin-dependent oxidoreductase alpha subunit